MTVEGKNISTILNHTLTQFNVIVWNEFQNLELDLPFIGLTCGCSLLIVLGCICGIRRISTNINDVSWTASYIPDAQQHATVLDAYTIKTETHYTSVPDQDMERSETRF
ncbi:Hypothetical predicted protein [Mytilus galloprovincialis]|uniref:Uncharacterized protein n=1 Tax=Mytilus galloprovincialis TaxID=29158 RepID=A0A8B6EHI3_MYTGA|nr:Hypothetical predicted protein [Mytilus galloprovincialis]